MSNPNSFDQIQVEAKHLGLFETPLAYCTLKNSEALLQDLEQKILQNMASNKGLQRSNIGGWHSETDMSVWGGESAKKLAETAVNVAKRMSHFKESDVNQYQWHVRMWANVTSKGGLNNLHSHPGNLWAAVLYVDLGEDPDAEDSEASLQSSGGRFFLEDPRFPMAAMKDASFRMIGIAGKPQQYETEIKLERGSLLVFPAWLKHGVRQYSGNRNRISIAMNIDAQRSAEN